MAQRGRPLDVATIRCIKRAAATLSIRRTAKVCGVDRNTARKYLRESR